MKVLLVTLVTLTAAIVFCSAADPECVERSQKGLPLHWPNPSDCGRFYRCTEKNIKREVICPSERDYNQKTGKCALRGKGVCTLSLIAPLADDDNICIDEISGTLKPQTGYCRNFYICDNDAAYLQNCPLASIFDNTLGTCVPDPTNSCWQNACNGMEDASYLSSDTSCLSFYLCYANEVVVQSCESGSYFNAATKNCVPDSEDSICWENFCRSATADVNIPNADDCHSYYECQGQTSVPQTCLEGNYFDKLTSTCLEGECPVETCTCPGGYKEGQIIPHPTDCTSFFICDNSQLFEQSCLDGNYFDCEENACKQGTCTNSNEKVRMKRSLLEILNLEKDIKDNEDVILNEKEETKLSETVKPLEELSNSNETIAPIHMENANELIETSEWNAAMEFMCMDRYFEGDVIADPDNCQQFKVCLNAMLIVQSCNPGTYFDENSLICRIDEDGTCSKKLAAIVLSQKADTHNDIVNCTCPGGYTDGQHLPHPTNCSLFYICDATNGVLKVQDCGVRHFYNEINEVCELDTTSSCWPITETNCTCPGNIQPWDSVAHPEKCNLFYICNGNYGILELQDCQSGNRFDEDTKSCVKDTCGVCNIPTDICNDQLNNTLIANPSQCFSFYLCMNEDATLHVCNATSWFDVSYGGCILDTNAACRNPCENTTGILFLPHLSDCTKYYFCNDAAMTAVIDCDAGSSFNPDKKICQTGLSHCVSINCTDQEDGKTFPVLDDDTKFYYCFNGQSIEKNCLVGTNFDSTMGICLLQPSVKYCNQTLCVDAEDGLIAPSLDHQDTAFCLCRDGDAYLTPCYDGYTFDEDKLICYSDAPCDPAVCPISPDYTLFPNKNNTQSLCMCISNEVIEIDCPQNGTFNPVLMACQLPVPQDPNCDQTYCYSAGQYDAFPSLTANDNTTFCICEDGGAKLLDCPAGHTFVEYYKVCVSDVPPFDITKCQSDEMFFPVPGNIYAFYYCSDANTVQLINCPSNTVYDDHFKACLEDPCDQTVCEDPDMAGTSFAVIGNPYIFCYCGLDSEQKPYAYWEACDAGTMFNPKYNVCLAESVNPYCDVSLCADNYTGLTIPAINDTNGFCYCTSSNTAEKFSCLGNMKYDPILRVCVDDMLCNGQYAQHETIANPNICNKYYLCFNGDLLDLTCPNGTYFNSEATHCIPNDKNQCLILSDDCTCPGGYKSGEILPHPTDCSLYYICSGGKLIESSCGTNNYYDKLTNACQHDETNCCATSATRTCVGNYREGEFVAHPTNAQSYYTCTNGRLMPASCGTGNVFDRKSLTCIRLPKTLTSYKWKRSSFEMQDVRTLFKIKPIIKKLTGSFGNIFA